MPVLAAVALPIVAAATTAAAAAITTAAANAELNATAESATASTSLKFVAVGDWVRSAAAAHTSHAHTPPLTLLNQPHTHAGRPT